jgi:tRNA A37 threonylcarbamoyladenosine dehydratase
VSIEEAIRKIAKPKIDNPSLEKCLRLPFTGSVSDFEARFGGIQRLYGHAGLERLRASHVAVVGVGGVGSWTVEALVRSGIGKLTLMDADEVCVSNVNRQLPALDGEIGVAKVEALARRMRAINPELAMDARQEFFTPETAATLLSAPFSYVVDAIDTLGNKALLIAECRKRKLPIITSGGAGGRKDGSLARIADLAQASHDPLLQKLRKKLRAEHQFPADSQTPFGIPAVYSPELPTPPESCEAGLRMDCNSGYGAVTFVTGVFGFLAAGWVVNAIANSHS